MYSAAIKKLESQIEEMLGQPTIMNSICTSVLNKKGVMDRVDRIYTAEMRLKELKEKEKIFKRMTK